MPKSQSVNRVPEKNFGAYYTSEVLSEWLLGEVLELGFNPEVILDPAAGDGSLLQAVIKKIQKPILLAFDIDPKAIRSLKKNIPNSIVRRVNALKVSNWKTYPAKKMLIYSNPPWGAEINELEDEFYRSEYGTALKQYDVFDLFVERIISELDEEDYAAIFLPDSLLLGQHVETRRLITTSTTIHLVVRLPEGSFQGVNMGCLALIIQKKSPKSTTLTSCARVSRSDFKHVLLGKSSLSEVVKRKKFQLSQLDWASKRSCSWPLDVPPRLTTNIDKISQESVEIRAWDLWFESGRGLETGKNNKVFLKAKPKSGTKNVNYLKVAVGEDLNRRSINPSRFISRDDLLLNFNPKKELSKKQRLFVRKTGIGLKAAIGKGIITTQTIFSFTPKPEAPPYALHYAAAFLTSRVVIAMHLLQSGQLEWKSHPYVTQRDVKNLPLPLVLPEDPNYQIAIRMAEISEILHVCSNEKLEKELDYLVLDLLKIEYTFIDDLKSILINSKASTFTSNLFSQEYFAVA